MKAEASPSGRLIAALRTRLLQRLEQPWTDASYACGAAGQLLCLAALDARAAPDTRIAADWMAEALMRLLELLPRYPHGLFQGAQGLLFAALELDRAYGLGMAEDAAQEADEHLLDGLRHDRDLPEHFDVISGLAGLLVYAAYRERQGSRLPLVAACLARLSSRATRVQTAAGEEVFWFTPPAWIRGFPMGDAHPTGCTDLGLAHGQAGVLAALAFALASGRSGQGEARGLLHGALRHLRRHESQDGRSHFGAAVEAPGLTRCAWCYGDLGTAAALQLSALALDEPALEAWAQRLLQTLSQRPLLGLGFVDAWLCHGSVGSAWLLRQLAPGQEELAGRFEQCHPLDGEAGLLTLLEQDPDPNLSLLEGYAGLALVLAEQGSGPLALPWSLPFLAGQRALWIGDARAWDPAVAEPDTAMT
ncbi:lanthionine synthetase LanC family protein [Paucibacter sp. DJ2R-2]|uniref:lanthionine synthetase LanC family protein n=1 Tax=Paucibacter sp. DJ2R-2 TaxID=2893558 RepID=UPI0021E3F8D7|nr:lanthionine synthetase LanC family protein [Paucibacter sp. DJ2R-2]MCV2420918.1 hypothetical protein [Paucibacter sp. DJ4R-1]MCV2438896.1 hypothetical protein [Paucibacter sp. DJ2R-2]